MSPTSQRPPALLFEATDSLEHLMVTETRNKNHDMKEDTKLWTPFFLRQAILSTFSMTFVAIMIALAGLHEYSVKHQGLTTAKPEHFLIWQYAPTAVFTLIAAFWAQLEYRVKQLMPWKMMTAHEPPTANRSILLDFVSPLNIVTLFTSTRIPGCVIIAVATGGGLILKLIIVLSTGLFVLQYTPMERERDLTLITDFGVANGTAFEPSSIDWRPVSRVYAIANYSLPHPSGTYSQYAFQKFDDPRALETTANTTANAQVFVASAACEALTLERADSEEQWIYDPVMYPNGTIDHVKNQDPSHVALNITLSSESCSFINFRSLQSVGYMAGDLVPNTLNTTRTVICNNSEPRFIVSLSSTNVTDTMRPLPADLIKYSGTICRPKYGIYQAAITVNVNNSVVAAPMVSIEPDAQPSMLPNVSATDLVTALGSSLAAVYNDMDFPDYLLKVHARLTQEEILSNGTLLAESVQETFPKVAAQIVDMYLTISAQQRISGYAIEMENRLIVRSTGFVSLEVLFICMTACTIWVMRKRPGNAVSRDPGSVIGMATILARSPQLCKALQGTGSLSLHTLRERIHEKRFNTSIQGGFGISESYQNDPDPNSPTHLLPLGTPSRKIIWYRPFSVKSAGKVLAVMAPVVVLAALEAVLQMSQAHAGLADIPHNRYVHYSFTLLPTAILVGIGMMFAALDFSARIFHPFHLMRRGNAYWSAISSDLLGKVGLHCFWDALRQQNIALANASLCIILSPFLTIVASGLFFTVTMPQRYDIRLSQIDSVSEKPWYSYLNSDMSDNQEAFTIVNLIFFDNSSEPLFTYNDLAFPRVEFLSPTNQTFSDHFGNSQVSARLPALRARTNCTFLPDDMILDTTYDKFTHQGSNLSVMFEAQAPEGCGWGQYSTSNNESVVFDITVLKDRFFGIWRTTLDGLVNRPWCPITWAIFGQAGDRQATSVTAMHCRPYMERVDTDVTFNAKDFSFDPTKPPVPDESTAVYIQNISWSQTETNIFVPSSEDADPSPLSITMGAAVVDGLFAAVLAGRDGVPGQDLLGLANRDRLRAAVQRVYGRTFAQIFNTHRETAPPDAPALPAALEVPYRVRLKQSAVSTRILEGLLGVIALSAVLTFATLDTRRVLPKNPCSIAAMASLLAGADMLQKDVIPEGTEYMSGREMKEKGVFEGYLFTMGWWSNGRFGIDIGKAEPEQPAEG